MNDNDLIFEAYHGGLPHTEVDMWGNKRWLVKGKCHREDGPAIITPDGTEIWCYNDVRSREDGPAVIYKEGIVLWYLDGKRFMTPEKWARAVLNKHEQPSDPEDVARFLRPILAKQTKDLI